MKAPVRAHAENRRHNIFKPSADNVQDLIKAMMKDIATQMDEKADETFTYMRRDYRSILGGEDLPQDSEILPRE